MAPPPFYHQQPFCQMAPGCKVAEIDPPADLSPFVAKLGYINIRSSYVRQKVPDACLAIVVAIHERSGEAQAVVSPPPESWQHWDVVEGWTYLEARLRWGAGAQFLRSSPGQYSASVGAEEVLGSSWRNVADRIADTRLAKNRMLLFVDALRRSAPAANVLRPEIIRTIALLEQEHPGLRVDEMAAEACLSTSQLRRLYAKEVGATPKELVRLSRLWWSMKMAIEYPDMSWGSIALQSGYSDQAHLVGDYRHFTGATPRGWFANLYGVGAYHETTPNRKELSA